MTFRKLRIKHERDPLLYKGRWASITTTCMPTRIPIRCWTLIIGTITTMMLTTEEANYLVP